ncbi:Adenylylsulfate kinase (EC [Amycolatopsis camponoti]|uniref:Adenylylsulfate kinase (EC) n=1 Tax=Amycolatopsis camponoti TaxID=2606593 RepID=A0A6I8LLH2_9PSEU|nr:adenylyl-sulfate kinase [Amycolatopsis camponoti]VVJ16416.1 Adenylylsulfate kinase (EC [Amycolatopsis camponoti]
MSGPGVVWLTGLSGAGKSTVAELLDARLRADGIVPVRLDGDEMRAMLPFRPGYTRADRLRLARFYARLAAGFAARGHLVICATISLFHEVHAWNRAHVPGYFEVWLRVPVPELRTRAGRAALYRGADEVVGAGIEPELPRWPDLVIDNRPPVTAEQAAELVHTAWRRRIGREAA